MVVEPEQLGLWDTPAAPAAVAPITRETAASAGRKLTARQLKDLERGFNPLGQRLHVDAAPVTDKTAPGRRCGNCRFRTPDGTGGTAGTYPKCRFGADGSRPGPRMSRGPATDCRAWWPGCSDHVPAAD